MKCSHRCVKHQQQDTKVQCRSHIVTNCDSRWFCDLVVRYKINADRHCELH